MKIADVRVRTFNHTSRQDKDSDGHSHPCAPRPVKSSLLTIVADDGSEGHCFSASEFVRPHLLNNYIKTVLIGEDPFARERLWQDLAHWQRGSGGLLTDRTLGVVDQALWDLAGRKLGVPVYKLIGSYRDKVPAYGSTMCGDEIPGGLATPEDYGRFAEQLVGVGYKAIKLHTWMKPVSFAPDPKMDVKACAAVREAAGEGFPLMLDAYHGYSRADALWLGLELQKLGYFWYEEMMNEASMSSYVWLAQNLTMPVIGPESMEGKFHTRAEWIRSGASDISRTGANDVGGISPSLKIMHLAEFFGMNFEVHGSGPANLTLCAVQKNGRWYERGLLHPHYDYDAVPEYLNELPDRMDAEGFVHLSEKPGIGWDINFDYIDNNLAEKI
ncbi:MAG: mandelate racemase family protein [Acetobacteraceae bacterium]|nr:mandelate racemase family protein [Acetobacteraceae bacterium]